MKTPTVSLILCGGLLQLITGLACQQENNGSATAKGERGNRSVTVVTALGRLVPENEIIDVSAPVGRIQRLMVKEGSNVNEGDVLAYLVSHDEMAAHRDLVASQLKEAQDQLQAEQEFSDSQIARAESGLEYAEDVMLLQVQSQETLVQLSTSELDEARRDHARAVRLRETQAISESELDDAELAKTLAEQKHEFEKSELERRKAERANRMQTARAELRAAKVNKTRMELSTRVASTTQALRLAEARLAETTILAPTKGEILKILTWPGESIGSDPILKMGDTRTMFVTAEVYETDVQYVREGQSATITSPAFPGNITGRVERIGRVVYRNQVLSLDPTADADARIIEVRIRLDESDLAAHFNNHQVDVEIHVEGNRFAGSS